MNETVSISIAKAMKVKNRLAGRLSRVQGEISAHNSRPAARPEVVDVLKLFDIRKEIVNALLDLKLAICRSANGTIDREIRLLGEKKSELSWLQTLTTTDGLMQDSYSDRDFTYTAVFKKPEVDEMCRKLEREIDEIQDRLDAFNGTTKLTLDANVVNLAS